MENKTLIGKNGFLFLINDSSDEILCHKNGTVNSSHNNREQMYLKYIDKIFILVYPDKSYCCQQHLPDEYQPLLFRESFRKYKEFLGERIFDGYPFIFNEGDKYFYKTDTHMNMLGTYMLLNKFIDYVNCQLGLNIQIPIVEIKELYCENGILNLGKGLGDLRYPQNLGNQTVIDVTDTYYYNEEYGNYYVTDKISSDGKIRYLLKDKSTLIDKNDELDGKLVDWNIVNKYVIHSTNIDSLVDKKILIFYDSFTLNLIPILMQISREVYMMKQTYNHDLIETINPDLIFELRVERFL